MNLVEKFLQPTIPDAFHWFNELARYQSGAGLEIFTDEKTDFWQHTFYGFQRDGGHWLRDKARCPNGCWAKAGCVPKNAR